MWQKHDLIGIGETVVRALLGAPNEKLSKPDQLRWGTHGSKWYSIPDGRFYDHEEGTGGNLITVIQRYGDGRPVHEQQGQELWATEPELGRVADGIADRVDRLRLLGNGVVPQTAAKAWTVLEAKI